MSRAGWQFDGWWGIVLPAVLVIRVSNALTLAGRHVFDAQLLAVSLAAILMARLPQRAAH